MIKTSFPLVNSSKLSDVSETARSAPRTLSMLIGSRPGGSFVKDRTSCRMTANIRRSGGKRFMTVLRVILEVWVGIGRTVASSFNYDALHATVCRFALPPSA